MRSGSQRRAEPPSEPERPHAAAAGAPPGGGQPALRLRRLSAESEPESAFSELDKYQDCGSGEGEDDLKVFSPI